MKNLYIFLLLVLGIGCMAQISPAGVDTQITPGGFFDNVFDQYGNKFLLNDLKAGADYTKNGINSRSTLICSSGMFDLYFETGSGMDNTTNATENSRRTVVCQVLNDLTNFINSPLKNAGNTTRVKIWVRNINNIQNVSTTVLGLATSFYTTPYINSITNYDGSPTNYGGITDGEVFKTIQGGKDSYINTSTTLVSTDGSSNSGGIFYHGMMAFNFNNFTWNTNLLINANSGEYDLYSVVLHEVTHALGFNSLLKSDGLSILGAGYKYYTRYDRFLKNNVNTEFLIKNNGACNSMYNYGFNSNLVTTILQPNILSCVSNQTTCTSAIKFVGTSTTPVYTPNCFMLGSSFSHFEDSCIAAPNTGNDTYFVMSNAINNSVNKRYLKTEERNTLIDIGYSLNNTYGNNTITINSFNNYGESISVGNNVIGYNDGIISGGIYSFIGVATSTNPIVINGLLNNDVNTVSFECLEDITTIGNPLQTSLSTTFGIATTTVNLISSVDGLHLLRYVPIDSSGKRGNITYVYVYVDAPGATCATIDSCNLVLNGNFEEFSSLPSQFSEINKACGWLNAVQSTADYFHPNPNISSTIVSIPCNFFGIQSDNLGLNGYSGMFVSRDRGPDSTRPYYESIKTKLLNRLTPNTNYQLSFDVSLSEGASNAAIKFQAYLYPFSLLPQGSSNIIIDNPNMLFTNSTFSRVTSGWEKIIFNFRTGDYADEQFLYIGGLKNVQFSTNIPATQPSCSPPSGYNTIAGMSYYYVDNVRLIETNGISFDLPTSLCSNQILPSLVTYVLGAPTNGMFTGIGVTNTNGNYTFNPSIVGIGTHAITYTYTNITGCLVSISDTIQVTGITPTFSGITTTLCAGSVAPILPNLSSNLIAGAWIPSEVSNTTSGTYVFSPNTNACATTVSLIITVNPGIIPIFNAIAPICPGAVLSPLPTTSLNGIVGTWAPALNNTETTIYTFTPDAGQCATDASLTITVLPASDPTCNDCLPNLTLSTPEGNTTIVYKRQNWIETNGSYVINNTQNITMRAGNYINLKPNTHIVNGSVFHAKIEDCSIIPRVSVNSKEVLNNSKLSEEERIDIDLESIMVYPNPTDNLVTISGLSMKVKSIFINSMEGKIIHLSNPIKDNAYILDLSNYQKGIYMIRIETIDGKIIIRKLIKN